MPTTRRGFLAAASGAPLLGRAQPTSARPNILFILADDLGFGDLGCYGQKQIATPNLDRLAGEGTRFTQAYAGSTVCAPSRCALMTGLHTGHNRIRGNKRIALESGDVTVAEVLKRAGYRTAIFGKWGLGNAGTTGVPNRKGFDEWFGYLDQQHAHCYYPQQLWENEREYIVAGNLGLRREYSPDLFTERALDFLSRRDGRPYFLYLALTLPHANDELGRDTGNGMEVPSDEPYSARSWPAQERNFAAMVHRLDAAVGRVVERAGENTVVVFSSDNGPHREGGHDPDFFRSSGPLRGIKRDLYEGGIRVPAIVRWPRRAPAGRVSDAVWSFWDFLPTAAEIAGGRIPPGLDGRSVLPSWMGEPQPPPESLYWEFHEGGFSQAARVGDWKGVRTKRGRPIELYDLREDVGEASDVGARHPDVAARMERVLRDSRTESTEFPAG